MPTTTLGLYKPDAATSAPLVPILTNMQDSVDNYLKAYGAPVYANLAAVQTAIPSPQNGMLVTTTDSGILWQYSSSLSKWRSTNIPVFATYAAMTAAITSPSEGAMATTSDYDIVWRYSGTQWVVMNTPVFATIADRDTAIASPANGTMAITSDYDIVWRYDSSQTRWVPVNTPVFADVASLSAAISSPLAGDTAIVGTDRYYFNDLGWGPEVEFGVSGDNKWAKFASGLLICWRASTLTDQAINIAYGSLYRGTRVWTYGHPFIERPAVFCSKFQWGTGGGWGASANAATETSCTLAGYDIAARAAGTNVYLESVAIGKWK